MHCTCIYIDVSVNVAEGPIGVFKEEAYTYLWLHALWWWFCLSLPCIIYIQIHNISCSI